MKAKMLMVATVILAAAIYAQEATQIISESKDNTEPAVGITVSQPAPVAEEPAPAVVVKEEAQAAAPAETIQTVAVEDESAGRGTIRGGLISLNLKEVELSSVIRLFATLSEANIIVPDLGAEAGAVKVDVNLKNVEWKPALQSILDTHELELYEKNPGTELYSVRKKLPATEAAKNTRTFLFSHADIAQAKTVIEGIVGDRGQVYAYPQGNAVIVKTTQEIMDDVIQVAERIDQPRQQVLIESRILELTDRKTKDRGVDWGSENGLLKRAITASPDLQFALNAGDANYTPVNVVNPVNELTLNVGQLRVLMSALDQMADIKTVSSPKVIVANGETANINILTKIPKIQRSLTQNVSPGGGTLTTVEVEQDEDGEDPNTKRKRYVEYEFGIRLAVTPTVYNQDNIAVKIVPIISRENADKTATVSVGKTDDGTVIEDKYYAVDEKRVETTFMLSDKQTAVIGGLTETVKADRKKKVPLLSSVPLLRQLFTYTTTEDEQRENVIFVTVSLEDGKSFDVGKAVQKSRLTRKQLISDENDQAVDDREVELFKVKDQSRMAGEIKALEKKK